MSMPTACQTYLPHLLSTPSLSTSRLCTWQVRVMVSGPPHPAWHPPVWHTRTHKMNVLSFLMQVLCMGVHAVA